MPIGPTTYFGNERVFVDREPCIQAFRENIQNLGNLEYNVLFYHGIAGIGKSKLQKKLQKILDEEYPEIFWASMDLDVKTYRDIGTFLITLRNKIQEEHSTKFQLFNAIHAIYWKKLHPEIPLQKQNYPLIRKGEILDKIVDVLENSGKLSLAWEILNSASDSFRKWCKLHHLDISKIESLEPNKIEELLPGIFAADFFGYFGENSKFYIFIDTYEALWDGLRNKGSFHDKDEWIRDNLIPNMPGVSWIICGREKLLWVPECDPDWDMYLEQHPVDEIPKKDCTKFLVNCGIRNKKIRNRIIEASERVPYYLNLSVDTFEKINQKRQPIPEDFGKKQPEIFNIFVKYLEINEIRALKILSAPNFWDRDLFEILMKKFDTGFPASAFSELIKFSFIKTDSNEKYSIHQLMRKSLQAYHDPADRKDVHKFMLTYYSNKIEEIDIKTITSEHELALTEAFYHAKEALEAEELCEWFNDISEPFNKAASWRLIAPIYEEMLQILETELGPQHPDVAATINNLALLYRQMGDYDKALQLYKRALEIVETVLDPQHLDVAATINNLAALYYQMGDYDKALQLYKRALEIVETVLGPQHPDVATTLNNLAALYYQMGKYQEALPLYERALSIRKKMLDPQHPDVATTLNNLAELYRQMGKYQEALPLYRKALNIRKKTFGLQHPDIATILNNLAELYRQTGKYKKALLLCQIALRIREEMLDPQHPDIATTLNTLSGLYYHTERYEEALPLIERSLKIFKNKLGSEHPNFKTAEQNMQALKAKMEEK